MKLRFLALLLPLAFLVSCETTQPEKRHYLSTYYGMKEKAGPLGNKSMVREGDPNRLKRYTKVIVEDVKVLRPRKTNPNHKYADRAQSEKLAERFEVILKNELGKSYEITSRRGYDTLSVRAALTEIRPSNPALFAVNYMPYAGAAATAIQLLSESKETIGAGATTVEIEVVDSRSRRQLFAMVDQIKGSKLRPGGLAEYGQTEGAMRSWSRQVHRGIKANETKTEASTKKR